MKSIVIRSILTAGALVATQVGFSAAFAASPATRAERYRVYLKLEEQERAKHGGHRVNGFREKRVGRRPANPLNWRREGDSNPRNGLSPFNGLANRRLQPLGHLSVESGRL